MLIMCAFIRQRFLLCILVFLGLICNYMLRVNINIAIVEMVIDNYDLHNRTFNLRNSTEINNDKLDWSTADQEWVKAAFFYGYCAMQAPGGRLAELFGTKKVLGYSMVGTAILGLVTPVLASVNVWIIFALRLFQVFVKICFLLNQKCYYFI